jgi:four helix bundle suffix protein
MVQAARSGKQNIVEGSEDGKTSTEMELKLLNVARSSIGELREDYEDYIKRHSLQKWDKKHPRFNGMLLFCRGHNEFADYVAIAEKMTSEELCNMAITLCHLTDKMLVSYLGFLEQRFVTEGGIKERMYSARTGYRQEQDNKMAAMERENQRLKELLRQHGIQY